MDAGDRAKAAFDFAKDSTTQIIGLSTGVMTLTITFSKDLIGDSTASKPICLLKIGWSLYLLSILAGVWTSLALTGTLSRGPELLNHGHVYLGNIRVPSAIQVISFALGTIFTLIFAVSRF